MINKCDYCMYIVCTVSASQLAMLAQVMVH